MADGDLTAEVVARTGLALRLLAFRFRPSRRATLLAGTSLAGD